MVGFAVANSEFLKKMVYGLKATLTQSDRRTTYAKQFQTEVRRLLRDQYRGLDGNWQKREFYNEVVELFKEFEYEFLLLSIFFDDDAEYLFSNLGHVLTRCLPINYKDVNGLKSFIARDWSPDDQRTSPLGNYFQSLIKLDSRDLENRLSRTNPDANLLAQWLSEKICNDDQVNIVRVALLHFNKFWQIHYSNPYNYLKGIVVLAKIEKSLLQIPTQNLKVNLGDIISDLQREMYEILPTTVPCPLLDTLEHFIERDDLHNKGYKKSIQSFSLALKRLATAFEDLTTISLIELYNSYLAADDSIKKLLLKEVVARAQRGDIPSSQEIAHFQSERFRQPENEIYRVICQSNYIF